MIDIDKLKLDDPEVYKLLQRCDTTGVFQLESEGMRGYLKKLQADCFEDIVAMLALYRPGPLDAGMVDDYIDVKHGARVKYPHPMLEEILKSTNGIFLYQEQVMKSAQVMAGYSLGGADLLRRAMGKKKPEEMAKQRQVFVDGAAKKEINEKKANEIFDLIDTFSGYGFNKSHSVAYAYISYQTAWLKTHFPAPFMAAVLSGVMDDTDRIAFTINECIKIGLIISPPNVCQSDYEFSITDNKSIVYGLGAIKGVGEAFVKAMMAEREKNGVYQDIFDFCLRIERRYINRRTIEALIYSGAFDVFDVDRATLISTYPSATKQAEQRQNDFARGQAGLFSNVESHIDYEKKYIKGVYLTFKKMLMFEKSVMGYYLHHHPTDEYKADLKSIVCTLPHKIVFRNNREVRVLALISEIEYRNTQQGSMASIVIEDNTRKINAVLFTKAMSANSDRLVLDEVVVITGIVRKDFRDQWQVVIERIEPVEKEQTKYAKFLYLSLNDSQQLNYINLAGLIKKFPGKCPVMIQYHSKKASGRFPLESEYCVTISRELLDKLGQLIGQENCKIQY